MTLDLSKLTPAPWLRVPYGGDWKDREECLAVGHPETESGICDANHYWQRVFNGWMARRADVEFVCLARAAFEVMMRRKWNPTYRGGTNGGWYVLNILEDRVGRVLADDPFTALVEADRWYVANVEAKKP